MEIFGDYGYCRLIPRIVSIDGFKLHPNPGSLVAIFEKKSVAFFSKLMEFNYFWGPIFGTVVVE